MEEKRIFMLHRQRKGGRNIHVISQDTKRENSHGEPVASIPRVPAKQLGDDLVMIFCTAIAIGFVSRYCLRLRRFIEIRGAAREEVGEREGRVVKPYLVEQRCW